MARRLTFFLPAAAMVLVLLSPQQAAEAVRQAMQLCAGSVIPSLFPFVINLFHFCHIKDSADCG